MARKLFAMEDNEVTTDINDTDITSDVVEVTSDLTDTREEVTDVIEDTDAVEEAMDASDQLEEVKEVVEQAEEEGGLDPVAAEAVRIAVSAIAARLGKDVNDIIPSYAAENFQSKAARKGNTRLALEGITETLKSVWEKIKATLAAMWAKVKSLFTSSKTKTKKAAEVSKKFKEKVKYLEFDKASTAVEAPKAVSLSLPDKELIEPKDVINMLNTIMHLVTDDSKEIAKVTTNVNDELQKYIDEVGASLDRGDTDLDAIKSPFESLEDIDIKYPEEGYFGYGKIITYKAGKSDGGNGYSVECTYEDLDGLNPVDGAKLVLPSKTEFETINTLLFKLIISTERAFDTMGNVHKKDEKFNKTMDKLTGKVKPKDDLDEGALKKYTAKITSAAKVNAENHSSYLKFEASLVDVSARGVSLATSYLDFCSKQSSAKNS